MNTNNTEGSTPKRHRRRSIHSRKPLSYVGFLLTLTALVASFTGVFASHGDAVVDMTYSGAAESHNGAWIFQGGVGAGTGIWDPFLTVSANTPTEAGLNSIKALKQFDSFYGGTRTHPLLASAVPSVLFDSDGDGTPELWREFGLDANDQGADTWMSIDVLKVFLTDTGAVQYDPATENFTTGTKIAKIYDLGDVPILMVSQGLESGSGVSDISVLLPDSSFPCAYGDLDCEVWVVLYTEYGAATFSEGEQLIGAPGEQVDASLFDWDVSAGFEEWRTQLLPVVNIQKTAEVTYTRTYNWNLTKDFPGEYWAFIGDEWAHDYEVFADLVDFTDTDRLISGTITITNPTGGDIIGDSIPAVITKKPIDELNLGGGAETGSATVTCPVTFPYTLDAGEVIECTYVYEPGVTLDGVNTASVEIEINDEGVTRVYEGSDGVIFGAPTTEVNESVVVDDTNDEFGGPYAIGDDGSWLYSVDFACPTDQSLYTGGQYDFSHSNTASLTGDTVDLSDSETVTVHCYIPSILKTAAGTYDERHEWDVEKTVDPESQSAFAGDTVTFDWTVTV
ncbi:MAG: hypothetical protein GTO14_24190, partial [Anaerolineales bacterium]|nr:hypothetical protein [Anaerolineales bacterium]